MCPPEDAGRRLSVVAIVGRPNVGKSTLFNRLAGRRLAIVADEPGTTRDRVADETQAGDRRFTVVDTAGLEHRPQSDIGKEVRRQVQTAMTEADVILFVVDTTTGLTPADEEIAQELRRYKKPVVLVACKAETQSRQLQAMEFYELSMGDPVPVSAQHNRGVVDLLDRVMELLPPAEALEFVQTVPKLAIVGRPNTGKSTLLNAILQEERAVVNPAPGTTRDATDTLYTYKGKPMVLIDTAGIRRRGRVETGIEQFSVVRSMEAIERCDVALVTMDLSELGAAQDTHITGAVTEAFKGLVLVVNKWDLHQEYELEEDYIRGVLKERFRFVDYAPVAFVSAVKREGIEQMLDQALAVFEACGARAPTAAVNSLLTEAIAGHPPGGVGGRRMKFFYASQVAVRPPTFVFFVNDAKLAHFSYQRYLENKLRQAFGFKGTPIKIIFRSRDEKRWESDSPSS